MLIEDFLELKEEIKAYQKKIKEEKNILEGKTIVNKNFDWRAFHIEYQDNLQEILKLRKKYAELHPEILKEYLERIVWDVDEAEKVFDNENLLDAPCSTWGDDLTGADIIAQFRADIEYLRELI